MKIFIVTLKMVERDYDDDALMEWVFNNEEKARDFYTKLNNVYFPNLHNQYSSSSIRRLAEISINERMITE